ncbi:MAG: mechanosensitive ion channel [Bacteroidales bacterium]
MDNANILKYIQELFSSFDLSPVMMQILSRAIVIAFILFIAIISDYICKWIINNPLRKIAEKTKFTWDDLLFDRGLPSRVALIVPAFVVYFMLPLAFSEEMPAYHLLAKLSVVYIVAVIMRTLSGFLNALSDITKENEHFKDRPMKGIFQTAQVIVILVGVLIIIAIMVDKSLGALLAGLGASAAIISFIFKDSLVGLISGIQLSWNDMLRPGDWITVPGKSVNGVVFEVTLNTVKVRNFDNTIVTIPPMALLNDAFQNWRGMEDSAGRRIMRTVNIDMYSVIFADKHLIESVSKHKVIAEYLESRTEDDKIRGKITNLKLFRIYMEGYLCSLPGIAKGETLMVHYLAATSEGIPFEVYFFSSNKEWAFCEMFAADVIDHILAILPEFELRVFQRASGTGQRNVENEKDENKIDENLQRL